MGKSSMIMPDEFADMNAKETGSVSSCSDIKVLNIVPPEGNPTVELWYFKYKEDISFFRSAIKTRTLKRTIMTRGFTDEWTEPEIESTELKQRILSAIPKVNRRS